MKKGWPLFVFLLALQAGCGDGDPKIELNAVQTAGASNVVGDGATDYPDAYLTPTDLTVGLKSFKLIKKSATAGGGTPAPTPSGADYLLFDNGLSNPAAITLTAAPQQIEEKGSLPPKGTYDRAEYEIVYYELTVQVCTAAAPPKCEPRRVHLSLADRTGPDGRSVKVGDLLMTGADGKWGWVDTETGLPEIVSTRPDAPVQIPDDKLPTTHPTLFKATLPVPLSIGSDDDEKKINLTLEFKAEKLFFFDDTDDDNDRFNALAAVAESLDGKAENGCPSPCTKPASFWPGLPAISLTLASD